MRRALLVTYAFPPYDNARAIRWGAIVGHWARLGVHTDVVCAWTPSTDRVETREGVRVFRVGGRASETLRVAFGGARFAGPTPKQDVAQPGLGQRVLRAVHDHTWKRLYWPDSAALWMGAASVALRQLVDTGAYDALISVSLPFSGHVAGLLSGRGRPRVWLADVGDPFALLEGTAPNNLALYRRVNAPLERALLGQTNIIAVTTEGTRDRYRQAFPELSEKLVVIPPIVAAPALRSVADQRAERTMLFAGTLYRNVRNPSPLIELMAAIRGKTREVWRLHILGEVNDCRDIIDEARRRLGDDLVVHGRVAHLEARQRIADADVLVNIGNDTDFQLPSKVIEYAATGRPVLNVATTVGDSSARFLADYGAALTVLGRDERTLASVIAFLDDCRVAPGETVAAIVQRHGVSTIAERYLEVLPG